MGAPRHLRKEHAVRLAVIEAEQLTDRMTVGQSDGTVL